MKIFIWLLEDSPIASDISELKKYTVQSGMSDSRIKINLAYPTEIRLSPLALKLVGVKNTRTYPKYPWAQEAKKTM